MYIKGFDKDLRCRGMQFEVGKEYSTGAADADIKLCSNTVFHFCDSLQKVNSYYSVIPKEDNRFCEIEVLGALVSDDTKCGSNRIRIVREILGDELNIMRGLTNGNAGIFNGGNWNSGDWNSGNRNSGDWNSGNRNSGDWNSGDWNSGNCNSGDRNSGDCNSGNRNSGDWNSGNRNSGDRNSGNWNSGDWNSGDWNSGNCNSGDRNSGDRNSGNWNSGDCNSGNRNSGNWNSGDWNSGNCNSGNCNSGNCNSGDWNSGDWNSGNWNSGFFCTNSPKLRLFNKETDFTMEEFMKTEWYAVLTSGEFYLTKWRAYTDEEKAQDERKRFIVGELITIPYKEACANWWASLSDEDKAIIKTIPNFDKEIFKEITLIDV